jgi:hypothetical protein
VYTAGSCLAASRGSFLQYVTMIIQQWRKYNKRFFKPTYAHSRYTVNQLNFGWYAAKKNIGAISKTIFKRSNSWSSKQAIHGSQAKKKKKRDLSMIKVWGRRNFGLDPKVGVFLKSTQSTPCGHYSKWKLTPKIPLWSSCPWPPWP